MQKTIAVSEAGRPVGEDSPRCRWPDSAVDELRRRVAGGETVTSAAAALGMSFYTAWDLVRCRRRATTPAGWVTVRRGRRTFAG